MKAEHRTEEKENDQPTEVGRGDERRHRQRGINKDEV